MYNQYQSIPTIDPRANGYSGISATLEKIRILESIITFMQTTVHLPVGRDQSFFLCGDVRDSLQLQ
jgi:hypothetical protein